MKSFVRLGGMKGGRLERLDGNGGAALFIDASVDDAHGTFSQHGTYAIASFEQTTCHPERRAERLFYADHSDIIAKQRLKVPAR